MNRSHFLTCILTAINSGNLAYVAALVTLYSELVPDDRAERDGSSTRISE